MSAFILVALSRIAWSAPTTSGLSATLESKARAAFANIAKAKTELNNGNTKTSQSYLAKAQGLLQSVMSSAPGSGAATNSQPTPGSTREDAGQTTSAVSQAEGEAAKLGPSLGSKLGVGNEKPAQGDIDAGTRTAVQTPSAPSQQSTLEQIGSAYQKVTLVQSLLKAGNTSKAKSVLDQIPSSPLGLLKGAASGL